MAAVKFKLSVKGDKELQRKLSRLSKDATNRVMTRALLRAGSVLEDQAKQNAPRKTGRLANSIRTHLSGIDFSNTSRVVVNVETNDRWFGGKTFYGAFQEFGWRVGRRLRRGRTLFRKAVRFVRNRLRKKIPGKHYIKRALDSHGRIAQEAAIEEIRAGIEREASRGGG